LVRRYADEIADAERLSATALGEVTEAAALGDETAKTRLLQAHLQLVAYVLRDYVDRGVDLFDLLQDGNMGLIRAVDELRRKPPEVGVIDYLMSSVRASIEQSLVADRQAD
jgi:RNA polymerase sigma factor (sigma-70 family)